MDPRSQGQFVHEVFEQFFEAWQAAGHGAITPETSTTRARCSRTSWTTRWRGCRKPKPDSSGRGCSDRRPRPVSARRCSAWKPSAQPPVVERLLEHRLEGEFTLATPAGPRRVALARKGRSHRSAGRRHVPPDRLQARMAARPATGAAASDLRRVRRAAAALAHRGRDWTLGEAAYLAFKGPRRVVPLFANPADRDEGAGRGAGAPRRHVDAIARGEFPADADDVFRCETCSFAAVCRKDYVGDV